MKKIGKSVLLFCSLLAVIAQHLYNTKYDVRQSTAWNGPYLSAAANLTWPVRFQIDLEQLRIFSGLDDTRKEDAFVFVPSDKLTPYRNNDIGYVYVIAAAHGLFPFLGQQAATLLLQAIIHLLIAGLLLYDPRYTRRWKISFFLFYCLNPLVLRYVVFNHYYFWQVVPSFLILYLLPNQRAGKWGVMLGLGILPWAVLARSTTLLVLPLIFWLLYQRFPRRYLVIGLVYVAGIFSFFYQPSIKNPWHTLYIGVGAYANPFGIELSDDSGYRLYESSFSEPLSASIGGNLYTPEVYNTYRSITKEAVLKQIKERPDLYIRNAALNFASAFSLGYVNSAPAFVNYFLALLGGCICLLLFRFERFIALSIVLLSSTYFFYYPPIPAYMYGNYLLLVGGVAFLLTRQPKPSTLLYLSFNDGSDMRINKEVKTLAEAGFAIDFVGIGPTQEYCYTKKYVATLYFVEGDRKSLFTLLRYFFRCARQLVIKRYHSVHVINEPQLIALWPFMFARQHIVLDLFDSIFLRLNQSGDRLSGLKRLVYAPATRLIVTDQNRLQLLPKWQQKGVVVVPNYPYKYTDLPEKSTNPARIRIMYYGWLGESRGTKTARELLKQSIYIEVLMAGWFADEESKQLAKHPQVRWLGILPQQEAIATLAEQADYVLCVYAPLNENNINASPNKIYDAILTSTPVIINSEVKISSFVSDNAIGYVMESYELDSYEAMAQQLLKKKGLYVFPDELKEHYTWESIAPLLVEIHDPQPLVIP